MISISPTGVFKRSGDPELVAVIRPATFNSVLDVGYSSRTLRTPPGLQLWTVPFLQASAGGALDWLTALDAEGNRIRNDLEAFLLALYAAGANLAEKLNGDRVIYGGAHTGPLGTLDDDLVSAGLIGWYNELNSADLMVLSGAAERYATAPDGTQVDITLLGPADIRPFVPSVRLADQRAAFDIIRRMGMWGVIPNLYAEGWITFDQLRGEFFHFFPEKTDRLAQMPRIIAQVRASRGPVFTTPQMDALTK